MKPKPKPQKKLGKLAKVQQRVQLLDCFAVRAQADCASVGLKLPQALGLVAMKHWDEFFAALKQKAQVAK